jgi:hypothetical protein
MLDYESLRAALMPTHGLIGLCAIAAGSLALAAPKRPGLHPWAGRAFLITMGLAISVAAPVIFAGGNLFLMGMGLLVVYHGLCAFRLARLQPPRQLPAAFDRLLHPIFALAFGAFVAYGGAAWAQGSSMGLVAVVLGGISLVSVRRFHRFTNQAEFAPSAWVAPHIQGMAAAFIASLTAFGAAAGPRVVPQLPDWVLWLGPTLVLTPIFVWLGRPHRPRASAEPSR